MQARSEVTPMRFERKSARRAQSSCGHSGLAHPRGFEHPAENVFRVSEGMSCSTSPCPAAPRRIGLFVIPVLNAVRVP